MTAPGPDTTPYQKTTMYLVCYFSASHKKERFFMGAQMQTGMIDGQTVSLDVPVWSYDKGDAHLFDSQAAAQQALQFCKERGYPSKGSGPLRIEPVDIDKWYDPQAVEQKLKDTLIVQTPTSVN